MAHTRTEFIGVYYREGSGRKRLRSDGTRDRCYSIRYWRNGKWSYFTVGWESEGVTPAKAASIREEVTSGTPPQQLAVKDRPARKKDSDCGEYAGKRIKTKHTGVYYRIAKRRIAPDGKPDRCYDILYTHNRRNIYEKIGWTSEGYTVDDAVAMRGLRVKALRHPSLCPEIAERLSGLTLDGAWSEYQKRWLPNLKRAKDIKYIYERHLRPVFGSQVVSTITTFEIEDFKQRLLRGNENNKPLAPGSVKVILANLRRIINKVQSWGITPAKMNPMSGVHVRGADKKRERYLTYEEAYRLLEDLQMISCTLYNMSKISLYTGMRLREILALRKQDIDFFGGTIHIRDAKKGARHAFITEKIQNELSNLVNKAKDYLFVNPRTGKQLCATQLSAKFGDIVGAMGFNCGVTDSSDKVVFHTLRHTFCSWLAIRGVALYTIGELVGHKDLTMTQRYAKLSPDSKREALKQLTHPADLF